MNRTILALTVAIAATSAGFGALAQTSAKKEGKAAEKDVKLAFEVYKDAKSEFRWRLKSSNGKIIGDSGEGYKAKDDCLHGIDLIKEGASKATTDDKS